MVRECGLCDTISFLFANNSIMNLDLVSVYQSSLYSLSSRASLLVTHEWTVGVVTY